MKLRGIFALFTIVVMVKATWWSAAVQPLVLSLGAVMTATNSDVLDAHSFEWKELWEGFKEWIQIPFGGGENRKEKLRPLKERTNKDRYRRSVYANEATEGETMETEGTYEEITNKEETTMNHEIPEIDENAPEGVTAEEKSLLKLMFDDFWRA